MSSKASYLVIFALITLLSCMEDGSGDVTKIEEPETPEEEVPDSIPVDSTYSDCDAFIAEHMGIGTACCISGYLMAKRGDTLTYRYQINHPDAIVSSWVVLEGDISILAINDPQTVTVTMGANFTGGILQAIASGAYNDQIRLTCNDRVAIKAMP